MAQTMAHMEMAMTEMTIPWTGTAVPPHLHLQGEAAARPPTVGSI